MRRNCAPSGWHESCAASSETPHALGQDNDGGSVGFSDTSNWRSNEFNGRLTGQADLARQLLNECNVLLELLLAISKQTRLIDKQHMALSFLNGLSRKKRAQMMVVDLGDRTTKAVLLERKSVV